jgi:hypothetical protein
VAHADEQRAERDRGGPGWHVEHDGVARPVGCPGDRALSMLSKPRISPPGPSMRIQSPARPSRSRVRSAPGDAHADGRRPRLSRPADAVCKAATSQPRSPGPTTREPKAGRQRRPSVRRVNGRRSRRRPSVSAAEGGVRPPRCQARQLRPPIPRTGAERAAPPEARRCSRCRLQLRPAAKAAAVGTMGAVT